MEEEAEEIVVPLCDFPVCMLCQQPLVHITHPILLPCTHYIVCLPCFEAGTDGPGRVKCPYCPQLYSDSSKDDYLAEVSNRLNATSSETLPQTEEEEKYKLAVYLLHYKESHPTDLAHISLAPEDLAILWDCYYCAESANDQLRCRKCMRVNLGRVENVELPESIAAVFTKTEGIEVSSIGLAIPAKVVVGMGGPVLADSIKEHPDQLPDPAIIKPLAFDAIKSDRPLYSLKVGNREETEQSYLLDEHVGWGLNSIDDSKTRFRPGSSSFPVPKPRPIDPRNPEFIQLPPEPVQFPPAPAPSIPPPEPKHVCPCCLLL